MHHVVLERWSRRSSAIHRRDPRAKFFALLAFLLVVATARREIPLIMGALLMLLILAIAIARLPLVRMLSRAGAVLVFSLIFAASAWLSGDPGRAVALLLKSYLSALAVLVVVSTTPLPLLLRGLEASGVPRFLLTVSQFLYRYLFVISEEAQHMRKAAASRAGKIGLQAAAGALAALFARSYARAQDIQRAMLARGFDGHFRSLTMLQFRTSDSIFIVFAVLIPVAIRVTIEASRR